MPLVLLDRDGVINQDSPHYIRGPADWVPIPGSLAAIRDLKQAGFTVAVCTNQAGIARGLLTESDLAAIHAVMAERLADYGVELDGVFVCPHGPDEGCECRKPQPGLLLEACAELGHEPRSTPYIGDSGRDLEAARRAGARPYLVLTGNGQRYRPEALAAGAPVFDDLADVASTLIANHGEP